MRNGVDGARQYETLSPSEEVVKATFERPHEGLERLLPVSLRDTIFAPTHRAVE
jgi:hypothetical protein